MMKKFFSRKLISAMVILVALGLGYWAWAIFSTSSSQARYVLAAVTKGTLIVSVGGSGQVSASNQVDIKPKASGDIVYVGVTNGQEVKAGTLIAKLDARDAQKVERDAKANVESAKLALEKLKNPADALSILQAANALAQAKDNVTKLKLSQEIGYQKTLEAKQKAEDDLKKAYEDGFNTIANAFLDLPDMMAGLQDILFGTSFSTSQLNLYYYSDAVKLYDEKVIQYRDDAYNVYQTARKLYDKNFADYKSASRFSDTATVEKLIGQTYDTGKSIAEAVKSANNLIQFYQDKLTERNLKPHSISNTHLSTLNTYTGKINTHLLNLLSIKRAIQTAKETITNAQRDINEMTQNNPLNIVSAEQSVKEKEEFFAKLKAGPDSLDIQSQELTIKQRENSLLDAKEKLADYVIRPPFDGVIAKVNIKKADSVSSGVIAATLITKQKLAEISLNEVDVAKIKAGQKTTLTFDAIPNLTITGQVAEIDALGAVSQGVVTYTVKIAFDTQDERVKPSMSVSAAIITEAKPNALLVPNSAVKSQNNAQYVEIVEGENPNAIAGANTNGVTLKNTPRRQMIEAGFSNDEFTEIVSGLNEGDFIVARTIQPNATQPQSAQQSGGLRIPGLPGGGGGGRR